jgi:Uma2 family endonuclease
MVFQTKSITLEEFETFIHLPENADRDFEYIGGEIVEVVSNNYSSAIAILFATYLGIYLLKNRIGRLTGADGGYMVVGERYIPDVGFISNERQPKPSFEAYNSMPPDLAIEVLSPTNEDDKMRIKVTNYLLAGTHVWVADPIAQTVEVYQPGIPVKVLRIDDSLEGGEILPGFTLALKDIFAVE